MEKVIAWARDHKIIAVSIGIGLLLLVGSAWSAYRFRAEAIEAKKEIQAKEQEADDLSREEEVQRNAWQTRIGDSDAQLARARREIRTLRDRLGEVEARRRDLFVPPVLDNLAARFDKALEAIR